jgi:hypothetical protein
MQNLYTSNNTHAVQFRENIRAYNGALAFTSVNYGRDRRLEGGRNGGFRPFQIQGELYHLQGPLENEPGVDPLYSQVWIHDPEYGNAARLNRNRRLDPATLGELTEVLEEVNRYVPIYKTARDQLLTVGLHTATTSLTADMALVMPAGADPRRQNLPTVSEVAAVVPDVGPGISTARDIWLTLRTPEGGSSLRRLSVCHPSYLPLHYVLLFPYGDPGWHDGMELHDPDQVRERHRLTLRMWHAYRLFTRRGEFNTLFRAQRLFQQYVVDAAATYDQNRLNWVYHNQSTIRADQYQGLADAFDATDGDPTAMGRTLILPSSHTGSQRSMHAAYMDAMAITGHFGKPHLFLTMTANPEWEEVVQAMRGMSASQKAMNRPDLVTRVFDMKKKQLMREIFYDNVFGKSPARVWTIEYQKRGLPHLHLLVFLENSDRLLDPDTVDEMVCAEIPDSSWDRDGELAAVIRSAMIHGPCAGHDNNAACLENGRCSKRYPRPFNDETSIGEDGYPLYRRRDRPETSFDKMVRGSRVTVDNRWVVPYNPYLTRRYKAHINVEICSSIKAIKYLYKYVYKGKDRSFHRVSVPSAR